MFSTQESFHNATGFTFIVLLGHFRLCYHTNNNGSDDDYVDTSRCCDLVYLVNQTTDYQNVVVVYNGKSEVRMYIDFTEVEMTCSDVVLPDSAVVHIETCQVG